MELVSCFASFDAPNQDHLKNVARVLFRIVSKLPLDRLPECQRDIVLLAEVASNYAHRLRASAVPGDPMRLGTLVAILDVCQALGDLTDPCLCATLRAAHITIDGSSNLPVPSSSEVPATDPLVARRCGNLSCSTAVVRRTRRCGGCGVLRYCNEACSIADWRRHRPMCRLMRQSS